MNQRLWITVFAGVVALAVLVLTLQMRGTRAPEDKPIFDLARLPRVNPAGTQPGRTVGGLDPQLLTGQSASGYYLDYRNKRGNLVRITGSKLTPRPEGLFHLVAPMTTVDLDPLGVKVLKLQSREGEFYAPQNRPRHGTFQGDVVLTFYEGAAGRPADLRPGSPDARLHVNLDDAQFDLDLGTVESVGPVRLSSERASFQGTGLSLTWNEQQKRIERLLVRQGRELRVRQGEPGQAAPGPATVAGTVPAPTRPADHDQYYRARFDQAVTVRDAQATLAGERMELIFALAAKPGARSVASGAGGATATAAGATQPHESDLVVTWTGPLVMRPEADLPPEMTGDDDVHFVLSGRPLSMVTRDRHAVGGLSARYFRNAGLLRLDGDGPVPATVQAPRLGTLSGRQVVINQADGTGYVKGPGQLLAAASATTRPEAATDPADFSLPAGSTIAWQDRLDLTFHRRPAPIPGSPAARAAGGDRLAHAVDIAALKTADFRGQVAVKHPDLDLTADEISLALGAPPAVGGRTARQAVERLEARGQVDLFRKADRKQEELALKCDQARLELATAAAGRYEPSRVLASGQVRGRQGQKQLEAGELDIALGPAPARTPGGTAAAGGTAGARPPSYRVRTLKARHDVKFQQPDPPLAVTAAEVFHDVAADRIDVTGGAANAPAVVTHESGRLTGPVITITRAGEKGRQNLAVVGAGEARFAEARSRRSAATRPAGAAPGGDEKPVNVTIAWKRGATFDNRTGLASFLGEVRSHSQMGLDTHHLSAGAVDMQLEPGAAGDGKPARAAGPAGTRPADDDFYATAQRSVERITAREDAVFQVERWADKVGGNLATRLRIEGAALTFHQPRVVEVPGPGKMVLEDYRPAEKDRPAGEGVPFTGRGATLFTWSKGLRLEGDDFTLQGTVQMVHREAGTRRTAQLDCQQLLATLASAGAAGAALSGPAADVGLKSVFADEKVRVLADGKVVATDHLLYDAASRTVVLTSDPGRTSEVSEEGGLTAYKAEKIKWDLKAKTFEILRLGGSAAPAGPRR